MPLGPPQGGHIDTPRPEKPILPRRPRRRINTPDPAHETPTPASPSPEPRIWQLRQRLNPYFMGREALLQQLHEEIQRHALCHLHGPPGSGTTQTALAYAFRARSSYDAVFWLDGRDPLLLRFDISQFDVLPDLPGFSDLGHSERVEAFRNWLETHDRWLVIADGLAEFSNLSTILPEKLRGKVLLTGHVELGATHIHNIDHGTFPDDAARQFLAYRSQQPLSAATEAIVDALDRCSLSIYLIGACAHTARTSTADLATRLETSLESQSDSSGVPPAVVAALSQSLNYVSVANPVALDLMALCAHFDCHYIPLVTLYDGAPFLPKRLGACVTQPETLDQALSLLFRLGLVQFEQNSISIHHHIQGATRQLVGREQGAAWLMTALRVVLEAFPVESQYTHPIPACSVLVRHALAVTRLSEGAGNLRDSTGALLNQLGLYLHACGELDSARRCFERAIALAESLYGTAAHPTVASRTNSLGVVLQDGGNYEEARACYQRAFELCEAVYGPARDAALGPAHRSMLTMPSRNLCKVLELMGDIDGARAAYTKAIETFIEVYCWNHSVVAECLNALGQLLHRNGQARPATACFLRAIQSEENAEEPVLGALAQYTRNLAHCLLDSKQFEEARKFYEHALVCDRDDFGPAHESVAADLQGLARVHRARSRFDAAHQCLDEALAVWNSIDPRPTLNKSQVWRLKGRCYLDADEYEDALRCLENSLKTTLAAAGPTSPALGPDYLYSGRALIRMERYAEAEAMLLKALHVHETTPWLDGEGLSALYGRLVRVYRSQDNFQQAAAWQKRSLKIDQARYGEGDERVGTEAYSLGNLYLALEARDEAAYYFQMALDIFTETRGEDDERTLRVRRKLEAVTVLPHDRAR